MPRRKPLGKRPRCSFLPSLIPGLPPIQPRPRGALPHRIGKRLDRSPRPASLNRQPRETSIAGWEPVKLPE